MLDKELGLAREKDCSGQPQAVVVADDESLRLSLVFLLEICGIHAVAFAKAAELLANCRLENQFIMIDCPPSGCRGLAEIEELRRLGWQGTVIFMAEGEQGIEANLPGGPSHVLVKPFSAEDVLAIIRG